MSNYELPNIRARGGPGDSEWTMWSLDRAEKVAGRHRGNTATWLGVHAPDGPEPGLFPVTETGIDMTPARWAVDEYLRSLGLRETATGRFPMDDVTLRMWANGARYYGRHGLCMEDMTSDQRARVLNVIRACLSGAGFAQLLDIMHLNRTIGELRDELELLNEWLYWFSVYGSPETGQPWGWQLDGHHLVVNCVIVGDQMTLTPSFMGAEPKFATGGMYAGAQALTAEQDVASTLFSSLEPGQQQAARIAEEMPHDLFAGAYRDNLVLNYEGLSFADMDASQRALADDLVRVYVDRAPAEHARRRMDEIRAHASRTHFAWIDDGGVDGVFYYRVHSPVILIEFEHMSGVLLENDEPARHHIHTVVRTPNGGDYGTDILRQHHEQYDHR